MIKEGNKKKDKKVYRYSTLENTYYAFAGAAKWQPLVIVCTILFAMCVGFKDFVWIYGGKRIIAILENANPTVHRFSNIVWIVGVAAVIEGVLILGMEISKTTASSRITDIRTKFILMTNRKVMTMPFELLENPEVENQKRKSAQATGRMTEGIEGILRESAETLARLIMMIIAAVILLILNPFLVLIMCALAFFRGWIHDRMQQWEKENYHDKMNPKWREEYYYYMKSSDFEFAKDIRIFNMKDAIEEKTQFVHDETLAATKQMHHKWKNTLLKESSIGLLQEGIMYASLIYAVLNKGMSIADFTLYIGSIRVFNVAVSNFLEHFTHMVRDSRLICDYRDYIGYPEQVGGEFVKSNFKKDYAIYHGYEKKKYKEISVPKDGQYEFVFDHVSFSYPGSVLMALKDLTLTLKPGKRLAVVGLNGAGKSTFIKLLCRLYEPTKGKIYMNGEDISLYDKDEYYKLIAPVFQNVESFAFPLAQNISMTVPEKTDKEKARKCLIDAGLGTKLESLEEGLETELLKYLKPEGLEFSGGENQKMALARALYKEAPIVVLDEPTAALDALAEYKTYLNFDKLIGGKTAVYISHRLSSTRFCHNVAMFEHGEMVEYGTHEDLLNANGAYATMFQVQAQYYREEEVAVSE